MYQAMLMTFGVFIVISVAGLAALWDKTKPQRGQPEKPKAAATADQNTALEDYLKDRTRCPKLKINPELLKQFPELPNVLATLKYVLEKGNLNLDRDRDKTRREQILQALDDPNFELSYSPPQKPIEEIAKDLLAEKAIAVGRAVSANQVDLSPFAGGALKSDGMPARNPFRLAHTILHEMVHITQIRHDNAPVSSAATHSGRYETAAYRWEHSFSDADKALFHEESWKNLKLPCTSIQKTENPDGKNPAQYSFALVVDGSNSMNENNRMKTTKDSIKALLDSGFPPGSEVGMLVFLDCGSITWHEFTMSPSSLKPIVESVTPTGSTPLGEAVAVAGKHLKDASGSVKKLILATDGKETCGGDPVRQAAALAQSDSGTAALRQSFNDAAALMTVANTEPKPTGITVDVLGIDINEAEPLLQIANAGKGKYYPASNVSEITKALNQSVQSAAVAPSGPELAMVSESGVSVALAALLTALGATLITVGVVLFWTKRPAKMRARAAYMAAGYAAGGPVMNPMMGVRCPNPNCGRMLKPGWTFCSSCGARVP